MKRFSTLLACAFTAACLVGCGMTPSTGSAREMSLLHTQSLDTLDQFKMRDASLANRLSSAYAYAIFPEVTTAAVGVGGGHGKGEVYQGGRVIGYADVSQGNVGIQLGAQKYSELVLFETQQTLQDFQNSTLEFDAKATAIAAASGAGEQAAYTKGVLVFNLPQGGLMFQAAIGGQKFRYQPAADANYPDYRPGDVRINNDVRPNGDVRINNDVRPNGDIRP